MKDERVKTYPTPVTPCPGCNDPIEFATGVSMGSPGPEPGDATVCVGCGVMAIFKDDMQLRLATEEDLTDLDEHTKRMLRRAHAVVAARNRDRT